MKSVRVGMTYHRGDGVDLDCDGSGRDAPVMVVSHKVPVERLVVFGEQDSELGLIFQVFEHARHEQLMALQSYG